MQAPFRPPDAIDAAAAANPHAKGDFVQFRTPLTHYNLGKVCRLVVGPGDLARFVLA
jgi:hypothetical protein